MARCETRMKRHSLLRRSTSDRDYLLLGHQIRTAVVTLAVATRFYEVALEFSMVRVRPKIRFNQSRAIESVLHLRQIQFSAVVLLSHFHLTLLPRSPSLTIRRM